MLGGQAAAWAQHGAVRLGVLQGMGLGMVQLWLGLCVLRFELVHTGRSVMRKHLWVEVRAAISRDHFGTTCREVSALRFSDALRNCFKVLALFILFF